MFSYVGVTNPPPPPTSSSIQPHYLTPSHFFIHPSVVIMYPLFHPSIRHRYVPISSSILFFIHPSISIRYPTSSRALFHPSMRHHYVPTSSSIHASSLCTHFFIHPSVIIIYALLHPSFFIHPSSSSRARSGETPVQAPSQAGRPKSEPGSSQSPGGQNRRAT
jgi:hypothetical protein